MRTFLVAALLTYVCGMLVFVGYALLGGSPGGAIVGLLAGFLAILFWRNSQREKIFPRNPSTKSVVILAVCGAVLTVLGIVLTA